MRLGIALSLSLALSFVRRIHPIELCDARFEGVRDFVDERLGGDFESPPKRRSTNAARGFAEG